MRRFIVTLLLFLSILPASALASSNNFSTTLASASSQFWSITNAAQTGLNPTDVVSFSGWVKFTTLPGSGTFAVFLAKSGSGGIPNRQYVMEFYNDPGAGGTTLLVYFYDGVEGGADSCQTANLGLSTGVWYQFGVSWTASTQTGTVYENGSSITCSFSNNGNTTINSTTQPFEIGQNAQGDGYINAKIDEVLFYHAAIGGTVMGNLYTNPCAPSATNLVSEWSFENNGNDSAGSNTLTNNNSATFTSDTPFTCTTAKSTSYDNSAWAEFLGSPF